MDLPKFAYDEELTKEKVEELSQEIQYARFKPGYHDAEIAHIHYKGTHARNTSWLSCMIYFSLPGIAKVELETKQRDDGTEKLQVNVYDDNGERMPVAMSWRGIPSRTLLWESEGGGTTTAVWLSTIKFLTAIGVDPTDLQDIARNFSTEQAINSHIGKSVRIKLAYNNHYIERGEDELYRIKTKAGLEAILISGAENEFESFDLAEGQAGLEGLEIDKSMEVKSIEPLAKPSKPKKVVKKSTRKKSAKKSSPSKPEPKSEEVEFDDEYDDSESFEGWTE